MLQPSVLRGILTAQRLQYDTFILKISVQIRLLGICRQVGLELFPALTEKLGMQLVCTI